MAKPVIEHASSLHAHEAAVFDFRSLLITDCNLHRAL